MQKRQPLFRGARTGWVASLLTWVCATAGAAPFAGPIDATTPGAVRIRGSDAIAGLGDWALSNGVLCAAVLGVDSEGQLVAGGGSLVDLGHCGRDDDQFIGAEPLYNFSQMEFLRVEHVSGHATARSARIETFAEAGGISLETEFVLDVDEPDRLLIRSHLRRRAAGEALMGFAELVLNTNNALRNFTRNRLPPSEGFAHVDLGRSGYLEIAAAIRSVDATYLIGSDVQGPPIAYRYRVTRLEREDPDGQRSSLTHFGLNMESVSLVHVFPEALWFESDALGVAELVQTLWMDLEVGSSLWFEREIRVSKRADVAAFDDADVGSKVSGTAADPRAQLHFDRSEADGVFHPFTVTRATEAGDFQLQLPTGRYRLRVQGPAGRSLERTFSVGEADLQLTPLEGSRPARVTLPRGDAMRLAFRGLGNTADPLFGDDHTGATIGGRPRPNSESRSDIHLAGLASDPDSVDLAAGNYRVRATRGPEYSTSEVELKLRPGENVPLDIAAPVRELQTPGWISADFHVHAAPSFDSTLPQRQRVVSFVAEGGEVIVATDHDVVSSYADSIRDLGLSARIRSIVGVESTNISHTAQTPHSGGHVNVFPVPFRAEQTRGGALRGEGLRLRDLIRNARALPGAAIVQLNHPRDTIGREHGGSYFEHLAVVGEPLDPSQPLDAPGNRVLLEADPDSGLRDIDFDAIELLNGTQLSEYPHVRRDWFALWRAGFAVTGLANSDTHNLSNVVAVPRSYVAVDDDRIAAFSETELIESVRRGAAFGTTGPLLDVRLGDAGPGGVFRGDRGTLQIGVRSASWIPVSTARVFVDGQLYAEIPIEAREALQVELAFTADAFIVVEVEGSPSAAFADLLPGLRPLAFSNPIRVDADADGQWRAPDRIGPQP
jgi:hypothetical protein